VTDIILTGVKIFFDFKLKRLDKNIFSANKKEEKRIEIYETLYSQLDALTYIEPKQSAQLVAKISEIDKYVSKNNLYISDKAMGIINRYCDYFRQVSTDFRKKDVRSETDIIRAYKELFNK